MKGICIFLGIVIILASLRADAAPGDLDLSFGSGGIVTTAINGNDSTTCMALQSDGKIVVAGYSYNGSNYDFAMVRYNNDGSLDTSFNNTGKVVTDFGGSDDYCRGITLQNDGKIILAGGALTGNSQVFALTRYNPDGSLDVSFGPAGSGKIKTSIGQINPSSQAEAVKVQSDGKIVAAGHVFPVNNHDFALVRYNANGSLDSSFGIGGLATTDFTGHEDYGKDVTLQSDGKIVVCGYAGTNTPTVLFAVVRYNSDGSLDTSFNGTGKSTGGGGYCFHQVLQSDGKVVLVGVSGTAESSDFCLERRNGNGTADVSFNGTGRVTTGIGIASDSAYSVALQSDGKLVACGYSYNANTNFQEFALARYNLDGSLDTGFHSTGKVTTAIGFGNASINDVAIGTDGKIVTVGSSYNGSNVFTLARYYGRNEPPLATTAAAIGIVRNGAVLVGTVNPNSLATSVHFEYGLTTSYGNVTSEQSLGNTYAAASVSDTIGGLSDNTLYHYRLVAVNAAGTTYGADAIFTTAPNPPLAFTGDAANVNVSGATLVGVVIPNGRDTTTYFEFGLSTAYGAQSGSQLVPASGTLENVFAPLTGLIAGATYHFRLVAINAGSPIPISGVDKTFVAQAPPPVVTLGAVAPLTTTSVSLSGTVNANGATTQMFFDYGTDGVSFPISVTATPATVAGGSGVTPVSGSLVNLSQGVVYYYRLRAISA